MPRFLVTGGCGFIGSHLVDALLRQGHQVRVLDDLSSGRTHNLAPEAELLVGDVADPAIANLAMTGVTGCFHLAAIANANTNATDGADWSHAHRVNQSGLVALLEAALPSASPVVYASSAAVYGDSSEPRLVESLGPRPDSLQAADKLGCELQARVVSRQHGLPTTGLRFFHVYGPRQTSDALATFAADILAGRPLALQGGGEQMRDFVFVVDAVTHLIAAMERLLERQRDRRPAIGGVFNVCTGQATRIRDAAVLIARLSGRQPQLHAAPASAGDIRRVVGDPSAAIHHLRVAATTALDEGLRATLSRLTPEPQIPVAASLFALHWSNRLLSQ